MQSNFYAMKILRILGFLVVLGLGNATVKALNWTVTNSNDKSCVIKGKDNSTFGKMKYAMVDDSKMYRFEYKWKTQTGERSEKRSWIENGIHITLIISKLLTV